MHIFRRRWAPAALLAAASALASPSIEAASCARVSDELVADALAFAVRWSGYPEPATLPPIQYWSAAKIGRLPVTFGGYKAERGAYVFYDDGSRVIVLTCQPEVDTRLLGALAHEIVHALQDAAGAPLEENPAIVIGRKYEIRATRQLADRPAEQ